MNTTWPRRLIALVLASTPLLAGATDFVIVVQGQAAGHVRQQTLADGTVEVDFSYRDNGRGPDLRERIRHDASGLPVAFDISGRNTYGTEVQENFRLEGGRARWTSRVDSGDLPAANGFAFVPLLSSPAYFEGVLRALLAQPDGSLPTLAGLRLVAERVARLSLPQPGGAPPLPLALVTLTGADTNPGYFWLRDDGSHALFAQVDPGWATVPTGQEAAIAPLLERQLQAMDERLAMLQQRLARPLPGLTVVRGVRWFDAPAARMRGPSDVWLADGRISAITAPGSLTQPADQAVDGRGRTLLPGLWDMHAHMWAGSGLQHLAAGVVNVRDPGNDNDELQRLIDRQQRGQIAGPRVHPSGFIEGRSPFSSRNGILAATLDEALAAVDFYAARGHHAIKLYNSIKPEWVRPLAARAHALGLRVTGHVPAFMRAEEAVRAGYDEVTHINQVMLNFVVRPGDDTRTLTRFTRVGDDTHALDLTSPKAKAFLRLLRARGTAVDTTLVTFEAMYTQAQRQPNPSFAAIADHLPVLWQRGLAAADLDLEGAKLDTYRRSYRRMLDFTGAMYRAGVPLLPGTDGSDGIGLHRELALYVQAGIPPPQALRAATWAAAQAAGASAVRGRIARGYAADLVLVDGDPSVNIEHLRQASLVIQGNMAYAPARLYEALGFKPFVEPAQVQTRSAP